MREKKPIAKLKKTEKFIGYKPKAKKNASCKNSGRRKKTASR